jgi:hypothetical protein
VRVRRTRWVTAAAVLLVLFGGGTATAAPTPSTGEFAPINQPGPRLSVPAGQLNAALTCNGPLRGLQRDPILLVPAPRWIRR